MTRVIAFATVLACSGILSCTSSTPPPASKEKSSAADTAPQPSVQPAGDGGLLRKDPAFDELVPSGAKIEKIATGFGFTEGPVWYQNKLWFSDIPGNVVHTWAPDGKVGEAIRPSGYDGKDPAIGGSNGLVAGKDGTLVLCQHGNRRVAVRSKSGVITTLVDRFEGKRLNSPNDAVYHSDGSLLFTDPPYGLAKGDDDPKKELDFNGVFRYANGRLRVLTRELTRPNGIGLSPNERTLYVANSDPARKIWMSFALQPDGLISGGQVFADVTAEKEPGGPDGLKVDAQGNVWATGPGGVWIFTPDGKHLGTIKPTEVPANLAWGGDGKTLFMTAHTSVYRIRTNVRGKKAAY